MAKAKNTAKPAAASTEAAVGAAAETAVQAASVEQTSGTPKTVNVEATGKGKHMKAGTVYTVSYSDALHFEKTGQAKIVK
jgi:hypothetical protein